MKMKKAKLSHGRVCVIAENIHVADENGNEIPCPFSGVDRIYLYDLKEGVYEVECMTMALKELRKELALYWKIRITECDMKLTLDCF